MLPDFPKSRKEIAERLSLELRLRVQAKSPLAALGRSIVQHEGKTFAYEQILDEGKRIVEEGYEEMSARFETKFADVPDLVGEVRDRKIDAIAEDIARQTSQLGYRKLDEATRLGGTAIDAGGQPFTQEMFLRGQEARQIDFDPVTGKADPNVVIIAHPDTAKVMHELWQQWEKDESFMRRHRELLAKKYEDWRDRESRRKLVD